MEEINLGKWVYYGENITLYPTNYQNCSFMLITYDYVLLQLLLP